MNVTIEKNNGNGRTAVLPPAAPAGGRAGKDL
jgi:hypothetical protein